MHFSTYFKRVKLNRYIHGSRCDVKKYFDIDIDFFLKVDVDFKILTSTLNRLCVKHRLKINFRYNIDFRSILNIIFVIFNYIENVLVFDDKYFIKC